MKARVIQVIETDLLLRGHGKDESDPLRVVRQYWSLDGELLAERDHFLEEKQSQTEAK